MNITIEKAAWGKQKGDLLVLIIPEKSQLDFSEGS